MFFLIIYSSLLIQYISFDISSCRPPNLSIRLSIEYRTHSLHLILDFSILVIKKDEKMFRKISFIYPPKRIILGINIRRSWNFLERNWPDISRGLGVIVRQVSNDSSKVSNLYRPLLSSVKKTTKHWPRLTFQRLKTDQLTPCSFVVIHSSPRTIQY